MVNMYNTLPASTKLLIHGLLAIVWSAAVTGGEAAYQSFTQSGHLNLPALLVTAWSAFLLYLIPAMYAYVPAHAQQLLKATQDEKAWLKSELQRSQSISSAVVATQGRQVQSNPVVPSHVVVPVPAALKTEDVQSIAAQLAMNLITIAANNKAPATPVAPSAPEPLSVALPAQDAMRHFGDSGIMPAIAQ